MSAYSDRIIADGASHYWRLGETNGAVALDIIGGATGTISGGVTLNQPGALSDGTTAMSFNAVDGKISTAANVSIGPVFSVEFWERTTVLNKGICGVRFPNATQDTYAFAVVGNTSLQCFVTYANALSPNSSNVASIVSPVANGQWHHIVWTFPGGTVINVYVDGVAFPVDTPLNRALVGSTLMPFDIGTSTALGLFWSGSLDEVAIYPRALTAAEIAAHYALSLPPEPPEQTNNNHDGSNLDAAVVELLKTDPELAALLPDGVYIDDAPPGAQRFAIVSLTGPTVDNHTMDGGGFEVVSYLVTANGVSSAIGGPQIKAAADRIDAILHDAAPVVDGFPAVSIARTGRVRPPLELDPDDRSIRWYRRGGTYELFASK